MSGEQHIHKAYASILGSDFEQAITHFEKAIKDEPYNASYHYKLSITYARSAKLSKALEHARKACELDDKETTYQCHLQQLVAKQLVQRAEQLLDTDQEAPEKVRDLLQQAVRIDPLLTEAYVLLGVVYIQTGERQRAKKVLMEAIRLIPDHVGARKLLSEMYYSRQER